MTELIELFTKTHLWGETLMNPAGNCNRRRVPEWEGSIIDTIGSL
jgi:hypothetical protein